MMPTVSDNHKKSFFFTMFYTKNWFCIKVHLHAKRQHLWGFLFQNRTETVIYFIKTAKFHSKLNWCHKISKAIGLVFIVALFIVWGWAKNSQSGQIVSAFNNIRLRTGKYWVFGSEASCLFYVNKTANRK